MNIKINLHRILFISILISNLFFNNKTYSQEHKIWFKHLTTKEGLSQNTVDCIMRDKQGFIWFGTWNGLNKYDGYEFTLYQNNPTDSNSISNNFIYSLCEDDYNRIWIGTGGGGINILDKEKEIFYHILSDSLRTNTISNNIINALYKSENGNIWIGSDNGLNKIQLNKKLLSNAQITSYKYDPNNPSSLSNNRVFSIFQDHNGNIWIGTFDGLNKFDPSANKFHRYYYIPGNANSIAYNNIYTIYEDNQYNLWVGTFYGLSKIDLNSGNITNYHHVSDDFSSLPHNTVTSIYQDNKGTVWIGNLGSLSQYNPQKDNFTNYQNDFTDDKSISNNFINSLYADDFGNVWIGTDKGGVNVIDRNKKPFKHWEYKPNKPNSLSGNIVNSIYEDQSGNLWIGTSGGGLNVYYIKTGKFKHFEYLPGNPSGLNSNFISAIIQDSSGTMWIGSWGDGINRLNKYNSIANNQFIHYQENSNIEGNLNGNFVSSFHIDSYNRLWIGTSLGLDIYDIHNDSFLHFKNPLTPDNSIIDVGCLNQDTSGNIWVGTLHGLYKIKLEKNTKKQLAPNKTDFSLFINDPKNSNSISGNRIITIYKDLDGTMWFGTYGKGFDKLAYIKDSITGKQIEQFINYSEKNGLSDNVVYGILEDNSNNLWLSTNHGLSRFNIDEETFKNYYEEDGIIGNQFFWTASLKNKTGELYFGTTKGMMSFFPENIDDNPYVPQVTITDFKIFNQSIKPNIPYKNKIILNKAISYIDEIKLSYKENNISFEFSALYYSSPEKITYAYKLDGFEENWVYVSSKRRFASYTNLDGGIYNFLVKATNNDGIWNNNPTSLKITIIPPFWKTLWFKGILFATITILIFLIYNIRLRTLKNQKQKLEKQVKERTAVINTQKENLKKAFQLLEQRKLEIFDQKEVLLRNNKQILKQRDQLIKMNEQVHLANQARIKFFTNISHEFRTPLTLIIGPIEKLISLFKNNEEYKSQAQLIKRNAQRLLSLINQLMDFRKIETDNLNLRVCHKDIMPVIKDIYQAFSQFASDHKIKYELIAVNESIFIWFDENVVERIIFNILTNAFKYTPDKGTITISLKIINKNNNLNTFPDGCLSISIKDSGIGIPENQLSQIFNRFYQVNDKQTLNKSENSGTGIGLALTKNLVELHHGEIDVKSEPGKGTEFIIRLPLNNKKYLKEQIVDIVETEHKSKNLHEEISVLENIGGLVNKISIKSPLKKKHTVLIVEDNTDLRTFITKNLKNEYNIIDVPDGLKAMEITQNFHIDLIVSDIMMPKLDGIELCTKLKSDLNSSHIPIILLTAKNSIECKIEGYKIGADDYIEKPFDMELLKVRIKNIIESRKKLRLKFSLEISPKLNEITPTSTDEKFLQKAIKNVEEFMNDTRFDVTKLVKEMGVSRSLLHKKLKALTNMSTTEFIRLCRLKKSIHYLKHDNLNISEVAYEVGFNDPKYFSRIFKKHFGVTPTEYISNKIELPEVQKN